MSEKQATRRHSGTTTNKESAMNLFGDEAHLGYKGDRTDTKIGQGGKMLAQEAPRNVSHDLYCIVLSTKKKKPFKSVEEVAEYRQTLVNDIVAAGLEVTLFYSLQKDEVYLKIGADDARLLAEADHTEYVLSLDEQAMKTMAESDKALPDRKPLHLEAPFDRKQRVQKQDVLGNWVNMSDEEVTNFTRRYTTIPPYKYLHARYNDAWERYGKEQFGVQIYQQYRTGAILRMADRMKLVQIILERSRNPDLETGLRGAGINLQEIVLKKKALGVFPLQNSLNSAQTGEFTVDELFEKWNGFTKFPWNQPLDEIRDYFGEKIALYFAFLGHYTKWLVLASFFGMIVFIHQLVTIYQGTGSANFFDVTRVANVTVGNVTRVEVVVFSEVPESAFYALFVSFWGSFMVEFWKRKQSRLAMQWGTSDFEALEVIRPEFVATHYVPSPVTGKSEPYYSWRSFFLKIVASLCIVSICIGVVVSAIAGIFVFKVFVSLNPSVTGLSQENATYMALAINSIVILILGTVYKAIARKLTEWENHRTDTQFEDALIAKTFIFCFVNSFATLFYLAFIKSGSVILGQTQLCEEKASTYGAVDACFGNLGSALLIVFLTQMVVNNTLELGLPVIMGRVNKWLGTKERQAKELKGTLKLDVVENKINDVLKVVNAPDNEVEEDEALKNAVKEGEVYGFTKIRSPCEDQFYLKSYEGTFDDFLEIALQFGYVTLFVSAFPLAPFLALVNNQLEIRVDSYKLCKLCRRPVNFGAQDIGTWQYIFYIVGFISVLTNAGVIFFTSRVIIISDDVGVSPEAMRVWAWVISVLGVLLCKWLVDYFVSDVPSDVAIQLKREEYIVRKCLLRERDDDDDDDNNGAKHNNGAGGDPDAAEPAIAASKRVELKIHHVDPFIFDVAQNLARTIIDKHGDLRSAMKLADKNKDGMVSTSEFKKFLHGLDDVMLTKEELDVVAESLDFNHNGKIELAEIEKLAKYRKKEAV